MCIQSRLLFVNLTKILSNHIKESLWELKHLFHEGIILDIGRHSSNDFVWLVTTG
jgi:hypothetical protein